MSFFIADKSVVNLRREPEASPPGDTRDEYLETQLLFNETVLVEEIRADWARVQAVEQKTFRKTGVWQGYPGWVRIDAIRLECDCTKKRRAMVRSKEAPVFMAPSDSADTFLSVSLGTRLWIDSTDLHTADYCAVDLDAHSKGWVAKQALSMEPFEKKRGDRGKEIAATARLFLGTPYLWGGRSMYMPHYRLTHTGVDCSGLTSLVFRAHGIDIPRDAHEQYMVAERISCGELETGDLVFLGEEDGIVSHVMLYVGGESCIEAPETGGTVRECTFEEKLGASLGSMKKAPAAIHGSQSRFVSFGRLIPCP